MPIFLSTRKLLSLPGPFVRNDQRGEVYPVLLNRVPRYIFSSWGDEPEAVCAGSQASLAQSMAHHEAQHPKNRLHRLGIALNSFQRGTLGRSDDLESQHPVMVVSILLKPATTTRMREISLLVSNSGSVLHRAESHRVCYCMLDNSQVSKSMRTPPCPMARHGNYCTAPCSVGLWSSPQTCRCSMMSVPPDLFSSVAQCSHDFQQFFRDNPKFALLAVLPVPKLAWST